MNAAFSRLCAYFVPLCFWRLASTQLAVIRRCMVPRVLLCPWSRLRICRHASAVAMDGCCGWSAEARRLAGMSSGSMAMAASTLAESNANVPLPTLGGKQYWRDVLVRPTGEEAKAWRIQQHSKTGHYRLLDGNDWRRTWEVRRLVSLL